MGDWIGIMTRKSSTLLARLLLVELSRNQAFDWAKEKLMEGRLEL
jgi:hypothetical protein